MVDLTSVYQVRLKKKIRELIKEDADALYAFKSRGFGDGVVWELTALALGPES